MESPLLKNKTFIDELLVVKLKLVIKHLVIAADILDSIPKQVSNTDINDLITKVNDMKTFTEDIKEKVSGEVYE